MVNLAVSYVSGNLIFYIAYLIISSIQLGATVDYAILLTERYKENRQTLNKKESIVETVSNVTVSVLTSGITMATVGTLLGVISTHRRLLSELLGYFLGRGNGFFQHGYSGIDIRYGDLLIPNCFPNSLRRTSTPPIFNLSCGDFNDTNSAGFGLSVLSSPNSSANVSLCERQNRLQ